MSKRSNAQKKLQQPKRTWKNVRGGLFELLKLTQDAGGVKRTVTDWNEKEALVQIFQEETSYENGGMCSWGAYSNRVTQTSEVVEFNNGNMMLNITISSWNGTFASHDDVRVEWWYGEVR